MKKPRKKRAKSLDLTNTRFQRMNHGIIDYKAFIKKKKNVRIFRNSRMTAFLAATRDRKSSICVVNGGYKFFSE